MSSTAVVPAGQWYQAAILIPSNGYILTSGSDSRGPHRGQIANTEAKLWRPASNVISAGNCMPQISRSHTQKMQDAGVSGCQMGLVRWTEQT